MGKGEGCVWGSCARGSKGNAKTTNELKRRVEGVSFNHIGRYRLLHGANMLVRPHSHGIAFTQTGAQKRISVSPFPFPHSAFPGV